MYRCTDIKIFCIMIRVLIGLVLARGCRNRIFSLLFFFYGNLIFSHISEVIDKNFAGLHMIRNPGINIPQSRPMALAGLRHRWGGLGMEYRA